MLRFGVRGIADRVRRAFGPRASRRAAIAVAVFAVSVAGVIIGVLLGGHTQTIVGPFRADLAITPSIAGDTTVNVPPLGALNLDSHDGPVHLSVRLGSLDQQRTQALINDPGSIAQAGQYALQDVTTGLTRLGLRTLGVAVLCTLALSALVFRNIRRVAWSGGLALLITAGSLGAAALTVRPQAIEEPRYEGLLANAPAIVGDARRIAHDYAKYSEQLQRLVINVSRIYTTVSTLPIYEPAPGTTRVLHVSDLHLNPTAWPLIRTLVEQFDIDAVIDTGDITDWGSEPEASFVASIGQLKKPYVYIRGNHDSGTTANRVASQPNAVVLNDSITSVGGLTIAGIGDPRFTPDKSTSPAGSGQSKQVIDQVTATGETLARTIRASQKPVDIALVHDPASASPLSGVCPLVLAGHTHKREVLTLPQVPGAQPTRLAVQGSTGGAGLRGLEGEKPTPLALSVLYFDDKHRLQAYDDIQLAGAGQSQVTLERHVVSEPAPANGQGPPSPSPTR